MLNIFIDDLRLAPSKYTHSFLTAESFLAWCKAKKIPPIDLLSLDHDLGEGNMDGYDLVKRIVELGIPIRNVQFHTDNMVGFKNMYYYLKNAKDVGLLPELRFIDRRKVDCIDGEETYATYTVVK